MKRLFYLSGTLFFLSLTVLVGVHFAQHSAEAKKPTQGPFVHYWHGGEATTEAYGMKENGDVWRFKVNNRTYTDWVQIPINPLPVPISEIAHYYGAQGLLITKSGEGWWSRSGGWASGGFVPN